MLYPFPDVGKSCLLCGLSKCARWKGYYLRKLKCSVVEFDGKIAIHVGHCKTQKRDFSYCPSFIIPYRQISRMSLFEFIAQWHPLEKIKRGIHWFMDGLESGHGSDSDTWELATSTAYNWIYGLVILLRMHSNVFDIIPPESVSVRAVRTLPPRILKLCSDPKLNWTPAMNHIRAPPVHS